MIDSLRSRKVLVVGGGIASVILAVLLDRDGNNVTIVEPAGDILPFDDGLTLTMNSVDILRRMGLMEGLQPFLHKIEHINIEAVGIGALSRFRLSQDQPRREVYSVMRSDLHTFLVTHLHHARVVKGASVHLLSQSSDGVSVTFTNGSNEWFDLVVGCDGINSTTRASLFGECDRKNTGWASWRFMAGNDRGYDSSAITEIWGFGRRFAILPVPGGKVHCFAASNFPHTCDSITAIDADQFRRLFSGFGATADYFVDQVARSEQLIRNQVEDISLTAWYSGRVALLGEAAYGTTANLARSVSMAMEDAFVLAAGLRHAEDVETAFQWYYSARRRRVRAIRTKSWQPGKVSALASPWLGRLRDRCLQSLPGKWLKNDLKLMLAETADTYYAPVNV